jgi:tRNA-modifying protein YgfZ
LLRCLRRWNPELVQSRGIFAQRRERAQTGKRGQRLLIWTELDDIGCVSASGPDAAAFLQGQLTADLDALAPHRSLLTAAATAQGRVVAVARAVRSEASIVLVLSRTEAAALRERLARYVLRARVTLVDAAAGYAALGLLDAAAVQAAETALRAALPRATGEVSATGGVLALALDPAPRVLVLGPQAVVARIAAGLSSLPVTPDRWRLAEIRAGVPEIAPATRELFVPQMLNLDLLDAIGFRKGCYTGQEIIARTQHLGRIKRRMVRMRCAMPAAPGTPVFAAGDVTGHVVASAPDGQGRQELLATVSIADANGALALAAPDGAALERLPLPYEVPELAGAAAPGPGG